MLSSIPVPLDSMFELFRGMNVGITMTGQAITQLPKAVQSAALTNAADAGGLPPERPRRCRAAGPPTARRQRRAAAAPRQVRGRHAPRPRRRRGGADRHRHDRTVARADHRSARTTPKLGRALRPQRRRGRRRAGGASWHQPADECRRCRRATAAPVGAGGHREPPRRPLGESAGRCADRIESRGPDSPRPRAIARQPADD